MEVRIKNKINGAYDFNWGEGWQEWNINDLTEWAVQNNPMLHLFLTGEGVELEYSPGEEGEIVFRLAGGIN